ncbi:MAG: transcription elongation factor Spt5 [Candidatus Marsarchaeota archaeon]|jgi:transcriptional antiterminator NusG|nr:transcription elongation factor Spt5 [Candidatus Marsarchaeota archaeon]
MYLIARVTSSQEKITADILENKAKKTDLAVDAVILPAGMRGYVILEGESENAIRDLIMNEPHVKGVLSKPLSSEELERLLTVKPMRQEIGINDTVEFLSGPFKGYKARVKKVDAAKDEITVELMDVAVPIPVTTKSSIARIIQKAEVV